MNSKSITTFAHHELNHKLYLHLAIEVLDMMEDTYIFLPTVMKLHEELNMRYSVKALDTIQGEALAVHVHKFMPGRHYMLGVLKKAGLITYEPVDTRRAWDRVRGRYRKYSAPRWKIVANWES